VRRHVGDEAELLSFLRTDAAAGQDHAHRLLQRDHARQALQATRERREPDARLGQREDRLVRGDDQIAGERDLESATHRHAIHGGDERLRKTEARRESGEAALGHAAHVAAGGLVLQIVPGRERAIARAGDDADPGVGVGLELVPDRRELTVRRRVERVHDLGPVDRHDPQAALPLDLAELRHASLPWLRGGIVQAASGTMRRDEAA
jgi:hypothetical protein